MCPMNCTAALEHAVNVTSESLSARRRLVRTQAIDQSTIVLSPLRWTACDASTASMFGASLEMHTLVLATWSAILTSSSPHPRLILTSSSPHLTQSSPNPHLILSQHRPSSWPLVQFANSSGEALCRNIEFPGRHVAKSLHLAQLEVRFHFGSLPLSRSALLTRVRRASSILRCMVA